MNDDEPRTVNTDVAIAITGATFRQIHHWIARGVITPTVPPKGPGSRTRWSLNDCLFTARIAALAGLAPARQGIHLEVSAALATDETAQFDDLQVTVDFRKIDLRTHRRWLKHFRVI